LRSRYTEESQRIRSDEQARVKDTGRLMIPDGRGVVDRGTQRLRSTDSYCQLNSSTIDAD
jgi:hypothetical protein